MSKILNTIYLNDYYYNLGAKFTPFAGFSMPINFTTGIINEHIHTRYKSGLFDISHMGQMLIPANDNNINKLENIIPQNLKKLSLFKCVYSFILNSDGGIIDDLIISKINLNFKEYFFIIYNASRKKVDEDIICNLISESTIIKNHSLIALQGPISSEILSKIFPNVNELSFMEISINSFNNENIIISRTGYTGEDGFELSVPNNQIKNIINLILNQKNVILCGLGCRDSLRLEAGLCLYGNELNESITPIEANLSWAISKSRLEKNNFKGSKKIIKKMKYGTSKIRIGLKLNSKSILRSEMTLHNSHGSTIGKITSGGYSPILKTSIAMAYINNDNLKVSKNIYCLIRDKLELIQISKIPFVKINYKKRSFK